MNRTFTILLIIGLSILFAPFANSQTLSKKEKRSLRKCAEKKDLDCMYKYAMVLKKEGDNDQQYLSLIKEASDKNHVNSLRELVSNFMINHIGENPLSDDFFEQAEDYGSKFISLGYNGYILKNLKTILNNNLSNEKLDEKLFSLRLVEKKWELKQTSASEDVFIDHYLNLYASEKYIQSSQSKAKILVIVTERANILNDHNVLNHFTFALMKKFLNRDNYAYYKIEKFAIEFIKESMILKYGSSNILLDTIPKNKIVEKQIEVFEYLEKDVLHYLRDNTTGISGIKNIRANGLNKPIKAITKDANTEDEYVLSNIFVKETGKTLFEKINIEDYMNDYPVMFNLQQRFKPKVLENINSIEIYLGASINFNDRDFDRAVFFTTRIKNPTYLFSESMTYKEKDGASVFGDVSTYKSNYLFFGMRNVDISRLDILDRFNKTYLKKIDYFDYSNLNILFVVQASLKLEQREFAATLKKIMTPQPNNNSSEGTTSSNCKIDYDIKEGKWNDQYSITNEKVSRKIKIDFEPHLGSSGMLFEYASIEHIFYNKKYSAECLWCDGYGKNFDSYATALAWLSAQYENKYCK